jgi:hypothetical protein
MKKNLVLIFLSILTAACQSSLDFNDKNKVYKGIDNEDEIYVTFIDDSIVAINSDIFKNCGWNFMHFSKDKNGLFQTNELKTDTAWFKSDAQNVKMIEANDSLLFEKIDLTKTEISKLENNIEISKNFASKGIIYECGYSIKEVSYFYERAIQEVKTNLKNPNSAKFNEVYIHKHKVFNDNHEYLETKTTKVSLDVEAKNGFGNFTEDTYYVFFTPKKEDNSKYDIEFSDSPILKFDLTERYQKLIDESKDELDSIDLKE